MSVPPRKSRVVRVSGPSHSGLCDGCDLVERVWIVNLGDDPVWLCEGCLMKLHTEITPHIP